MSSEPPTKPAVARFSSVHLLIALGLLFVSSPFIQELHYAKVVERLLVAAVFLFALLAVAGRGSLLIGVLLAGAAITGQWVGLFLPEAGSLAMVPALAFVIFVIARVLKYILSATEVDNETLCACLSGFLMIGLLWALGYNLLAQVDPNAFGFSIPGQKMDGFEAFYFSFVTLSTIGFGDITPVSRVARMLSVMEAVTGMFYVAVLVARLVSIYSSTSKIAKPDAKPKPLD